MFEPLRVVLLVGPSGVGKSGLGRQLSRRLRNVDYWFVETEPIKRSVDEEAMFAEATPSREVAYNAIYAEVEAQLRRGKHVILDAPHNFEMRDPSFIPSLATSLEAVGVAVIVVVVWITTDLDQLQSWLHQRSRPADLEKLADWPRFVKEVEAFQVVGPHLKIQSPDYDLEAVLNYVRSPERIEEAQHGYRPVVMTYPE